ncbi:MAG: hypothetical protein AAF567_14000 [Actinomycetota bacterium]
MLADDDLTTGGRSIRVVIVALFVLGAVASAIGLRRSDTRPLGAFVVWTLGYWLVRGTGILIGDWSVGFKVVHTVLWLVSAVLAVLAWRGTAHMRYEQVADGSGPSAVPSR